MNTGVRSSLARVHPQTLLAIPPSQERDLSILWPHGALHAPLAAWLQHEASPPGPVLVLMVSQETGHTMSWNALFLEVKEPSAPNPKIHPTSGSKLLCGSLWSCAGQGPNLKRKLSMKLEWPFWIPTRDSMYCRSGLPP